MTIITCHNMMLVLTQYDFFKHTLIHVIEVDIL